MRPKVAIAVFVISIVAAIAVVLLPKPAAVPPAPAESAQDANPTPDSSTTNTAIAAVARRASQAQAFQESTNSGTMVDDDVISASPEAKHAAYVHSRVIELQDLGMDSDPDSLETILSELGNRDPDIRAAAVAATVQFGSRDAIPHLEDAELQAADPHEKADIADAIEFLNLPTLAEAVSDSPVAKARTH